MKNSKAKMFNKKASDPKNKPDQIIESMGLKETQNIADIGSGGGYFSLRFAEAVGKNGKVYPVDTNSNFLKFIKDIAEERGVSNIIPILVAENHLPIPAGSLDFIFMRDVTHHIQNRVQYFGNLKNFLKPNGRIVIIEYKKKKSFSFHSMFGHHIAKEVIIHEMKEAGYLLEKDFDFLPEHNFTVYRG